MKRHHDRLIWQPLAIGAAVGLLFGFVVGFLLCAVLTEGVA